MPVNLGFLSFSIGSLVLAGLLYTWQFPHFMSLSWLARKDYANAGYVMTANVSPKLAQAASLRHSLLATAICFLGPYGGVNWCGGLAAVPFNAALVHYAFRFYRAPLEDEAAMHTTARRLFRASLIHLPAVLSVLLIASHCS